MDYLSHNVAVNLNRIRTSKGMSLDAVSEQTGVSKSMLAQIEKDELIDTPPMESCLVDIKDMIPTKESEGKYTVWTCFPYEDNHLFEIYRINIEAGNEYVSGAHGEKTREYISVFKGQLTIECNNDIQIVECGQVYRFETDKVHTYRNETDERLELLCVFMDYH